MSTPPAKSKTIVAISGSLRPGSSNHAILEAYRDAMPADVSYNIYNGLGELPHFNPALDNDNPPETVAELRNILAEADAVIICTPEYAYGIPGSLKNALDWTVSSGSVSGKPTALITASTGGENAHAALLKVLGAIDAKVNGECTLLISFIRSKMDADGKVNDETTVKQLQDVLTAFLKITGQVI